ncbi:MAG: RsbRD N-terminal domain-containing protein [bacterium]|nr:RsbRD N-terminal domain-containing protein [bacterium]
MAAYEDLAKAIAAKQKQILDIWLERTLNSYRSPGFFIKSQDLFANPVGMQVRSGLAAVFELLCEEANQEAFARPLDQVVRIRAVQDFSASQAVVPFLELKWVVKEVLGADAQSGPLAGQLNEFDCAVERVALMAFDLYCRCREQLYLNRIHELKSGRAMFTDGGCPSRLLDADAQQGADREQ